MNSPWVEIVRAIHASGHQCVIAVTGGGSGAIGQLAGTPGASRSVLEAIVPYSAPALVDWIGAQPEGFCNAPTARAIAMAAFERARRLAHDVDAEKLVGVGCTASLASDRPKRGEHRVHVAVQTAHDTTSYSLQFEKNDDARADQELAAASLLLAALATTCGVDAVSLFRSLPTGPDGEQLSSEYVRAYEPFAELLLGKRRAVLIKAGSTTQLIGDEPPPIPAVFPGAFNPPHAGHLRMAAIAESRLGAPVTWELSMTNVDKPPLDFISLRDRVAALRSADANRLIAVTRAATFREKAELFPGATFVVGADTMARIGDPAYYGGDSVLRDQAVAAIASHKCRFLVFGRQADGQFWTLGDLSLPAELRSLCEEVPAGEFRDDVSSTEVRRSRPDDEWQQNVDA